MLDKRPMSAFPNTEEFLAAHPEHDEIHAYIVGLAEFQPTEFATVPTPEIIESLAYMVTGRNYGGAYIMGGSFLIYMLLQEFKRNEWYEECAEMTAAYQLNGPYFESFHEQLKQQRQSGQSSADQQP